MSRVSIVWSELREVCIKDMHAIAGANTIGIYTQKVQWHDCMDRIEPLDSPILIEYLESNDRLDDFLENFPMVS